MHYTDATGVRCITTFKYLTRKRCCERGLIHIVLTIYCSSFVLVTCSYLAYFYSHALLQVLFASVYSYLCAIVPDFGAIVGTSYSSLFR